MWGAQIPKETLPRIQKNVVEESKGVRFDDTQDHIIGKY